MSSFKKIVCTGILGVGTLSAGICSAAIIIYGDGKLTEQEDSFAKNSLYPSTYAVIVQQVYVPGHYKKVYYQNDNVIYDDQPAVIGVTPGLGIGIGVGYGGYGWRGYNNGWGHHNRNWNGHHGGWKGHHGGHHH